MDIDVRQDRCVSKSLVDLPVLDNALACCAPLSREPMSEEQANTVAPLLKALADPVRLRLMSLVPPTRTGRPACAT
jgi:ArsR family transcriptional regulator